MKTEQSKTKKRKPAGQPRGLSVTAGSAPSWKRFGYGYMRSDYKATLVARQGRWIWRAYAQVIESAHGTCDTPEQAMTAADLSLQNGRDEPMRSPDAPTAGRG